MIVGVMPGMGRIVEASVTTLILTAVRIPPAMILGSTSLGLEGMWWVFTISSIVKALLVWFILI